MKLVCSLLISSWALYLSIGQGAAWSADGGKNKLPVRLYGHIDIVVSSCKAGGLTLAQTSLPTVITQVRLGSPAYYANLQANDQILSAQIDDKKMSLIIGRDGKRFSAQLNLVPVNPDSARTPAQNNDAEVFSRIKLPIAQPVDTDRIVLSREPAAVPDKAYSDWLHKSYLAFLSKRNKISSTGVLDVEGSYDETGQVLNAFGIPYTKISAAQLATKSLDGVSTIILNCPGDLPSEAKPKIRKFVEDGGYLLTTDWALDHCISNVFPGYIEWASKVNKQNEYEVFAVDRDPVLFNNAVTHARWHLNNNCHLIKIMDPDKVNVLARSQQLCDEDPDNRGAVAVLISIGHGKVLHFLGHFASTENGKLCDPAPIIGISLRQAIAANFIMSGLVIHHQH